MTKKCFSVCVAASQNKGICQNVMSSYWYYRKENISAFKWWKKVLLYLPWSQKYFLLKPTFTESQTVEKMAAKVHGQQTTCSDYN